MTDTCPYCGSKVMLRDSSFVYGRHTPNYGKVYTCSRYPSCDAYVGVHKGTTKAKGTLAKADLRYLRMQVHRAFDPMWRDHRKPREKRTKMYTWLSREMGIHIDDCHVGMFTEYDCRLALDIIQGEKMYYV